MLRAVVVGINAYPGAPLHGCLHDAEDVRAHLLGRGCAPEAMTVLRDGEATRSAIVRALRAMIAASVPGDQLYFHFSGHGTQLPSDHPRELEGFDEVLCPVDFDFDAPSTALTDTALAAICTEVPRGVAMTVVLDAGHSGAVVRRLALSGVVAREGRVKFRYLSPPLSVQVRLESRSRRVQRLRYPSHVAVVSACASTEAAAETYFGVRANGAFTHHWLQMVSLQPSPSLGGAVTRIAPSLERFHMHPTLDAAATMRGAPFLAASVSTEPSEADAPEAAVTLPTLGRPRATTSSPRPSSSSR